MNRHLLYIWYVVIVFLLGCSSGNDEVQTKARLIIDASVLGTRAGVEASNSNEMMKTLQIFVVRPNGEIEFTEIVNGNSGFVAYDKEIEVIPYEKKKLYLFANMNENVGTYNGEGVFTLYDFSRLQKGTAFNAEEISNLVVDEHGIDGPLPMFGYEEVEVKNTVTHADIIYMIRTVSKFTFRFENKTDIPVSISDVSIVNVADRSYLVPHINAPSNWLEWMLEDANDGYDDTASGGYNNDAKWIKDYDTPVNITYSPKEMDISWSGIGTWESTDYIYVHESKYNVDLQSNNNQQYTLNLKINGDPRSAPLPDIHSLVRNTHLIIQATINPVDLSWKVSVCPYGSYVLQPEFGL